MMKSIALTERQIQSKFSIPAVFTRPFLKIQSVSRSTTKKRVGDWRLAGYLSSVVTIDRVVVETSNIRLPLNQETILRFPLEPYGSYSLVLKPKNYLPNLTLKIWQIAGEWLDEDVIDGSVDTPQTQQSKDWIIW